MFKVRVDGDLSVDGLLKRFNLQEGGLAQQTLTRLVIDYAIPYWAWNTGRLANSAYGASNYATGEIVYDCEYAHKMYYGVDENGVAVHYNTAVHPLAGPYPIERMMADRGEEIFDRVRSVVGSNSNDVLE